MAGSTVTVDSNNTYDGDPDKAQIQYWVGHSTAWKAATAAKYNEITGQLETPAEGGGYMTEIYQQYLQSISEQNKFSWTKHLLVPGLQVAANILLLEKQKSDYDDIEEDRIGYIDAAISQWCECVDGILADIEAATDDVPRPAIYQAVSPSGEQWQTISDNLETSQVARQYVCYMNKTHREQEIVRAVCLNPKYHEMNQLTWCSIHDLMQGIIPMGMTVESLTRSKSKAVKYGRFGRSSRQTARDLGIIDYRLQKEARAEQRIERASQNQDISPIAKLGDIREMMLQPQQRIAYALQQAQLIQNSDQNANNACAKKAPYLMQKVQIQMQKCQQQMTLQAGKAGLVNSNVVDYASVLNSQIRDITTGIGNLAGGINFGSNTTPNVGVTPVAPAPIQSTDTYQSSGYSSKGGLY